MDVPRSVSEQLRQATARGLIPNIPPFLRSSRTPPAPPPPPAPHYGELWPCKPPRPGGWSTLVKVSEARPTTVRWFPSADLPSGPTDVQSGPSDSAAASLGRKSGARPSDTPCRRFGESVSPPAPHATPAAPLRIPHLQSPELHMPCLQPSPGTENSEKVKTAFSESTR